ncbi:hypothetical protein VCRA2123O286_460013 [Vibrio crassostreae]|nr:hypothetical protein VCRA2113O198_440013 [Vibrio crassostreae]CAK2123477.1 hypothetical protein VCRA2110O180_460004 [Vibrio crassostreae]CAK2125266.1 hypothetical protein VCRA2112O189_430004 [Vibrio crassostreae]CAK2354518.1 hypothetical protein VCRA2114O232_430006 [Vibrio crassostreae]CAK2517191.1 hypothetical protein VCRA2113O214_440011 [Vibrio crassostreae]
MNSSQNILTDSCYLNLSINENVRVRPTLRERGPFLIWIFLVLTV